MLTEHSSLNRDEILSNIVSMVDIEYDCNHYVYCLELNDSAWYVGETENIKNRFSSHKREKNVTNIELIEEVPDRETALERERELSYEMAIEKNTTEIYGGR